MEEVESDTKHFWKIFKSFVLLPINFFLFLIGKKRFGEVVEPIKLGWKFFWDARMTAILILLNFLVAIIMFVGWFFNPLGITDFEKVLHEYFCHGPTHLRNLNLLPMVLSKFAHGGVFHLLGNCFFLFIFGRVVEKNLGPKKLLLVYFLAMISSELLSDFAHWNDPNYYALGSSGAISGLGAVAMLIDPYSITHMVLGIPLPIFILVWFQMYMDIYKVTDMIEDNIGHFAHIGGYLSATLLFLYLRRDERKKLRKGIIMNVVTVAIFIILFFVFKEQVMEFCKDPLIEIGPFWFKFKCPF